MHRKIEINEGRIQSACMEWKQVSYFLDIRTELVSKQMHKKFHSTDNTD
jgi:hypothetical protein